MFVAITESEFNELEPTIRQKLRNQMEYDYNNGLDPSVVIMEDGAPNESLPKEVREELDNLLAEAWA